MDISERSYMSKTYDKFDFSITKGLYRLWFLLRADVCVMCAGQDVFVCGFAGALAGALTCGSVILNRNLHLDAVALAKKTKRVDTKKLE
jgi:hypothetical protein